MPSSQALSPLRKVPSDPRKALLREQEGELEAWKADVKLTGVMQVAGVTARTRARNYVS